MKILNAPDGFLPELTAKDIRSTQKEFDREVKRLEKESEGYETVDIDTKEAIIASLHFTYFYSKRLAKKKFTPKKYRYWERND